MAYVVPQVLVYQEFDLASSAAARDRNAHISGGHAYLCRYNESDEKSLGYLGYYDHLQETCYAWPNKPAGSVVDQSYAKVFIEQALLQYHQDAAGGGYGTVTVSNDYRNRITSSAVNYKANGDDYPRHSSLLDRDVQVGDIAKVRAVVDDVEYVKWTRVLGFDYNVVAAITGSAIADAGNEPNNGSTTVTPLKITALDADIDIDSASAASYEGLADDAVDEVYTILVIEGSSGGDATTARLRVTSATGKDDQASVTPAAFDAATSIGTRGLTVTFVNDADGGSGDFVVGEKWTVTVAKAYTAPTPASGGTYTGEEDTVYIVEVTRGGLFADVVKPQITVTTNNGYDMSGPHTVSASNTFVDIGNYGVQFKATGAGLCLNDRWTIACTAAKDGAARTLILAHNLDSEVVGGTDVSLTLYIKKDIQVGENRTESPPDKNYVLSSTTVCLQDGITAYDSTWTDDGVPQPLAVVSESSKGYGKAYVEYRAWLSSLAGEVNSVDDVGNLDDAISGKLTPDNPLKWAVYKALSNSNGVDVRFTAVADPSDVDSWLEVLEVLVGRVDVYGLVPLTRNQTVLDAFAAHVDSQSTPESGRWRVLWTSLESPSTKAIVDATTSTDDEEVLATITEDTDNELEGAQYTLVRITSGNADLTVLDVRGGDILRAQFTTDGFGNTVYSEYVIDTVVNDEDLLLVSGPSVAINTPSKIEIIRNLSATSRAEALAVKAGTYSNRRVMAVWPDTAGSGGTSMEGYHVCAALAGLASGVVPHQGLTNLELAGFDDVSRTTGLFNSSQLNLLSGGGVWVVTQDPISGKIYTRHAVTTADYDDINAREEMLTRNLDSISYYFYDRFAPYIGISNVTPSLVSIIETETLTGIQYLRQANFTPRLGGQLIDAEITELRKSVAFKDRLVLRLSLEVPYALNNLECHLVV